MERAEIANVLEEDDVGTATRCDQAEIGPSEPPGGVQGCRLQRPLGLEPVAYEAADHVVEAAVAVKIVRENVVGTQRDRLRQMAQSTERCHELGKKVIVRAAQLDGQAGAKFGDEVVTRNELVIGADAGRYEGLQIGSLQAARMVEISAGFTRLR